MEGKKTKLLTFALVALFASSVLALMPVISTTAYDYAHRRTVKIGVIGPDPDSTGFLTTIYKQIVEPDINAYVAKLPEHRFTPPIKLRACLLLKW